MKGRHREPEALSDLRQSNMRPVTRPAAGREPAGMPGPNGALMTFQSPDKLGHSSAGREAGTRRSQSVLNEWLAETVGDDAVETAAGGGNSHREPRGERGCSARMCAPPLRSNAGLGPDSGSGRRKLASLRCCCVPFQTVLLNRTASWWAGSSPFPSFSVAGGRELA
ncbi:hypothetical protein VTI74DRAFT_8082 [Chaetomium olivicolor]